MNTAERNRGLAERWFEEVWNERRDETIDELVADGAIAHLEGAGGPATMDHLKAMRKALLEAIPDLRVTVADTLASGSDVVVRWRLKGTHDGAGLGLPATGAAVDARGMTWLRFEDGRIVEGWDAWNQGALLGALEAAAARAEARVIDVHIG